MLWWVLLLVSFPCFAHQYDVAVCAIFQNEAPYFKEWIEYNRLIGVEHFYLYNNLSTDHYLEVLSPYIEEGIVELVEWPYKVVERSDWIPIQTGAYLDGAIRALGVCKWVAYIDVDEFIFPVVDITLPKFLARFEEYPAIVANWVLFGTSGVKILDPNKLMIEQLGRRAELTHKANAYIKTIVKPEAIDLDQNGRWNAHFVPLKGGLTAVNSSGKKVKTWKDLSFPQDVIRINHYSFRDESFFFRTKLNRPNVDILRRRYLLDLSRACNEEEDWSILQYRDDLRKAVFQK